MGWNMDISKYAALGKQAEAKEQANAWYNKGQETLAGYLQAQKLKELDILSAQIANARTPVEARSIAENALQTGLTGAEVQQAYNKGYQFRFTPKEYVAAAEGGIGPQQLDEMAYNADAEELASKLGLAGSVR